MFCISCAFIFRPRSVVASSATIVAPGYMLVAPNVVIPDMVAAVEHVTSRGVGSLLLSTSLVSFLVSVMMLTASRMFSVNSLPTLLLVLIDSLPTQLSFLMSPCVLSKDDFFEQWIFQCRYR